MKWWVTHNCISSRLVELDVQRGDPENKKCSCANRAMLTPGFDFVAGLGGILVYYGAGFPQFPHQVIPARP